MKKFQFLYLFCMLLLLSCNKREKDLLGLMIQRLDTVETIRYRYSFTAVEAGAELWSQNALAYFDLRQKNHSSFRYHLTTGKNKLVFNGTTGITVDNDKQQVVFTKLPKFNPYNPLMMSLVSLKEMMPQLLTNETVTLHEGSDTIINGAKAKNYLFKIKSGYIDWQFLGISNDFGSELAHDEHLLVSIDVTNYLPVLLANINTPTKVYYQFSDIDPDYREPDESIWDQASYTDHYTVVDRAKARSEQSGQLAASIGSKQHQWQLPLLGSGETIDFSTLAGKVVVLEFWFKGCAACLAAIPNLNFIYDKYKDRDFALYGVEFVEKFPDDILEKYVTENDKHYPNLSKGKVLAEALGVTGAPTLVILDQSGEVVYTKFGFDESDVTVWVDRLL